MAETIEEQEVLVTVDSTPREDVDRDPVAVDIMKTVYLAVEMVERIRNPDEEPAAAEVSQEYHDALERAIHCFNVLSERDDYERILRDFSRLHADGIEQFERHVVPVAEHFDIDIDLPTSTEAEGGDRRD